MTTRCKSRVFRFVLIIPYGHTSTTYKLILSGGDIITLTTVMGTRTYAVTSVTKVDVTDTSGLASTAENCITLYTCVMDQPAYRWCVRAVEV